jgi:hypothetical protein
VHEELSRQGLNSSAPRMLSVIEAWLALPLIVLAGLR